MTRLIHYLLLSAFAAQILLSVISCRQKNSSSAIATDSLSIARGSAIFAQHCSACHDFDYDGIGPHLGGITQRVSVDWIHNFVRDPKSMLDAGDDRTKMLFARFKTLMPSFSHLTDDELNDLVAFMHTQEAPVVVAGDSNGQAIEDPIPAGIPMSDLVVELEHVTDIPASAPTGLKTRLTKLGFIPGSDRHFIVDIRGLLYELIDGKPKLYMNMAELKENFIDNPGLATGFGSFAFHPEFLKNGLLYTGHTEKVVAEADFTYADTIPVMMQWVISEWKADDPHASPFKGSNRELFRVNVVAQTHGVQEFAFNPYAEPGDEDYGLLYIGIGDGTSTLRGYPEIAGTKYSALGSIFRIDPLGNNSANGRYGIPPSNPFAGEKDPGVVKEIYAYGFRNPHRLSWTQKGYLLASDIGQVNIESIKLVQPGKCYGWPWREGTFLVDPHKDINKIYPLPENDAEFGYTYPLAQYDHDEGRAVIGGFEYTGSAIPELKGKYLFADMNFGRLFFINTADIEPGNMATIYEWRISYEGKLVTTQELCGHSRVDLRVGVDNKGEFYLFSKQDGKVYRLKRVVTEGHLRTTSGPV